MAGLPRHRGPFLAYRAGDGTTTTVDTEAVTDPRERAVCRALLVHALKLLDEAEAATDRNPIGFN